MKEPVEIQYIEIALNDVLRYFAKDFDGYVNHEAFVDTAKNTVIFKLTIDMNKQTKLADNVDHELSVGKEDD